MLSNERIEKLALFFYFIFLDEVKAQTATMRTIRRLRKTSAEKYTPIPNETFVRITHEEALRSFRSARATGLALSSGHILIPENANWGPWFEFRKIADFKDFETVLYHRVVGFSFNEIAQGLDVPEGTVRYRVGHGLRVLGKICLSGERNA